MIPDAPRVEAVVFDLLYTLVHPGLHPGGVGRTGWIAGILGIDASVLDSRWDDFEPLLESGRADGEADPEMAWLDAVAADLGVSIGAEDRARIRADWDLTRREALLNPPADTLSALAALRKRKLKIGVLSNTHALEMRVWNDSPLAHLFDVVAFSHEIGVCKPDPAAYLHVLDRLGVPAASAAYVGDGTSNELAGAKDVGFGLVVLAEQAPAKLAPAALPRLRGQADATVSSLSQLAEIIER
jgi:putative hydrolase of the HAD superfamily